MRRVYTHKILYVSILEYIGNTNICNKLGKKMSLGSTQNCCSVYQKKKLTFNPCCCNTTFMAHFITLSSSPFVFFS